MIRVSATYEVKVEFLAPNRDEAQRWLDDRGDQFTRAARALPRRHKVEPLGFRVKLEEGIISDAESKTSLTPR